MALNERQQRFVDAYLADPNATQAAIAAGYSEKTAAASASRLLRNVKVAAVLKGARQKRSEETGIDAAWVLKRLKREAEFAGKGASHAARVSALALAMKHLGMMTEDAPHPDRNRFDLSGLSDADLDRITSALGPLFGAAVLPFGGAGEVSANGTGRLE